MKRGPAETPALFLFPRDTRARRTDRKPRADGAALLSLAAGYAGPLFS